MLLSDIYISLFNPSGGTAQKRRRATMLTNCDTNAPPAVTVMNVIDD